MTNPHDKPPQPSPDDPKVPPADAKRPEDEVHADEGLRLEEDEPGLRVEPAGEAPADKVTRPSDSSIDLGSSAIIELDETDEGRRDEFGGPISGTSDVQWSALVEEATEAAGVEIDSPSDADLHQFLEQESAPAGEQPPAAPRLGLDDEAAVNLAPAAPPADSPSSGLNLVADLLEEGGAAAPQYTAELVEGPSDVDLVAELADGPSTVHLGDQPPAGAGAPSSDALVAEVFESDVSLADSQSQMSDVGLADSQSKMSDVSLAADSQEKLLGDPSDVALDELLGGAGHATEESSAVDLGSAAVVEVPSSQVAAAQAEEVFAEPDSDVSTPASDVQQELEDAALGSTAISKPAEAEGPPSSAVNFGDVADAPAPSDVAVPEDKPPTTSRRAAAHAAPPEDVGLPAAPGGPDDEVFDAADAVEDWEEAAAPAGAAALAGTSAVTRRSARAAAAEEEAVAEEEAATATATAPRPAKPKYGRRWLGGIGVGALVGGLACVGLWAGGVEPPESMRFLGDPKVEKNKLTVAEARATVAESKFKAAEQNLETADAKRKDAEGNLKKAQDDAKTAAGKLKKAEDDAKAAAGKLKKAEDDAKAAVTQRDKARSDLQTAETKFKTAEGQRDAAQKNFDAADAKRKDAEGRLAVVQKDLQAADAQRKTAETARQTAEAKLKDVTGKLAQVETVLAGVAKKLKEAKVVGDNPKPDEVLRGVEQMAELTKKADPGGNLREQLLASQQEVQRLTKAVGQQPTPQEMLDYWQPLLQGRAPKEAVERAAKDVQRVAEDAKATPEQKAKALYVDALARRGAGQFAEARARLADALKHPGAPKADGWRPAAEQALKELSDPAAYYLPAAEDLAARGKYAEADQVLTEAQQVFPKEKGRLLAQRGLVKLEQAREKARDGRPSKDDPAVAQARKDAQDAVTAGAAAEGHYALGRIAEEVGDLAAARGAYQKAIELAPADGPAGDRYRLAKARVLWRLGLEKPTTPGTGRVGKSEKRASGFTPEALTSGVDPDPRPNHVNETLAVLLVLLQQPGGQAPGITPELREAMELTKKVLGSKAAEGDFMLKAQALAIEGRWNEALLAYAEGLRPHVRRDYADGLMLLILNHPALKRPESLSVPSPQAAELAYAAGLTHYYAGRYADAERAFLTAVQNDGQDARYFYFLGLSRLRQSPRDRGPALNDFEEGSKLERLGRPASAAVNTALERVQGPLRQELNKFRP